MSRTGTAIGIGIVVVLVVGMVLWATRGDGRSLAQDPCHLIHARVAASETSSASVWDEPQRKGSRCTYRSGGTELLTTRMSETDGADRIPRSRSVTPAQGCGAVVAVTDDGVEVRGQRWTVLLSTPGDPPTGTSRAMIEAVAASIGQSTSDRPSQIKQTGELPTSC